MEEEEEKILEIMSLPNRNKKIRELDMTKPTDELIADAGPEQRTDKTQENACCCTKKTDPEPESVYYVPLLWATDLANRAYEKQLINDQFALTTLIKVSLCNDVTQIRNCH